MDGWVNGWGDESLVHVHTHKHTHTERISIYSICIYYVYLSDVMCMSVYVCVYVCLYARAGELAFASGTSFKENHVSCFEYTFSYLLFKESQNQNPTLRMLGMHDPCKCRAVPKNTWKCKVMHEVALKCCCKEPPSNYSDHPSCTLTVHSATTLVHIMTCSCACAGCWTWTAGDPVAILRAPATRLLGSRAGKLYLGLGLCSLSDWVLQVLSVSPDQRYLHSQVKPTGYIKHLLVIICVVV